MTQIAARILQIANCREVLDLPLVQIYTLAYTQENLAARQDHICHKNFLPLYFPNTVHVWCPYQLVLLVD